jgi:hypothetical protein
LIHNLVTELFEAGFFQRRGEGEKTRRGEEEKRRKGEKEKRRKGEWENVRFRDLGTQRSKRSEDSATAELRDKLME